MKIIKESSGYTYLGFDGVRYSFIDRYGDIYSFKGVKFVRIDGRVCFGGDTNPPVELHEWRGDVAAHKKDKSKELVAI